MQALYLFLLSIGVLSGSYTIAIYLFTQKKPWHNPIGQMLLSMSVAVLAFYVFYLLVTIWPGIPGKPYFRLGLFVISTGVIVWRAVIYTRLIRLIRRDYVRMAEEAQSDS